MKKIIIITLAVFFPIFFSFKVLAQPVIYTVQPGDSLWKVSVKYEIGLSEIISANPGLKDPALIYPGQKISVPNIDSIKALENEVIRLVNIERSKNGLAPLTANWQLSRIARYKSKDMANLHYFSHTSPTYGSPFTMIQSFGIKFSSAGENIAMGQNGPASVMNAWMNSPGHRSNILSPSYTEIGVGFATSSNGTCYWTQQFIHPY